jgi:uncharacterized protein
MTMRERFLNGEVLCDEYIIDAHMHICRVSRFFTKGEKAEDILIKMDALGIRMGLISTLWDTGHYFRGNSEIINIVERYPDRFAGLMAFNPNYPEDFEKELELCLDSGCFKGVKLLPALHKYPIDGDFNKNIYGIAQDMDLPVLIHTWGTDDVLIFDLLAEEFPRTRFIMAHSGGELQASLEAIKLAKKHDNLYLDVTCSWMYAGLIETMVCEADPKQIIFGSDAVWNSTEAALGRIILADIGEEEKRDIIGRNAKRIFKLDKEMG